MAPLTEQTIKAKTKLDNLSEVRNLNLWGQDLDDVSILKFMPNVQILSLSVNNISTLRNFSYCSKLQELYLRKNDVADLHEVQYLVDLKELRVLWLCDNPCAEQDGYREYVVSSLRALVKLDNQEVTPEERDRAARSSHAAVQHGKPAREGGSNIHPAIQQQPRRRSHTGNAANGGPQSTDTAASGAPARTLPSVNTPDYDYRPPAASSASPPASSSMPAGASPGPLAAGAMRRTSPNILYAVLSLIAEMGQDDLLLVQKEVAQRLGSSGAGSV